MLYTLHISIVVVFSFRLSEDYVLRIIENLIFRSLIFKVFLVLVFTLTVECRITAALVFKVFVVATFV